MNLSAEKDYNGNVNPIRDVIPNAKTQGDTNTKQEKMNTGTGKGQQGSLCTKSRC